MCVALISTMMLSSCESSHKSYGTIRFDLSDKDGIQFTDPKFNAFELKGESGAKIDNGLPEVTKAGYKFLGWREKDGKGNYRAVTQQTDKDGNTYYTYPYGTDVLYPYFEKEVTVTFDVGNGVTLVKPENADLYGSTTGSYVNCSQYANKVIYSNAFLPTATRSNASFQYWYTEKKIVKVSDSVGGGYHFELDNDSETGVYRFDQAFGTDNMKFLSDDFTLKAKWEEYPFININFGIKGIDDVSFQAYDEDITETLKTTIEKTLKTEYSEDGALCYPKENPTQKLAGLYFDQTFTDKADLSIRVYNKDINLYLRWNKKAKVTLDYNGGKVHDKTSEELNGFYVEDTITDEKLKAFEPTKTNAKFTGWKLEDGTDFVPGKTKLTATNVLKASFEDNHKLTVTVIYPNGYSKTPVSDFTYQFETGMDVKTFVDGKKSGLTLGDDEEIVGVYQATNATMNKPLNEKEFVAVTSYLMPSDDAQFFISVGVKEKVTLVTMKDGTEEASSMSKSFGSLDTINLDAFRSGLTEDEGAYIFDGVYEDRACTKAIVSDRTGTLFAMTDREHKNFSAGYSIYRKMAKGVEFTFKKVDGTEIGKAYFIPGKNVQDNVVISRMKAKFNLTYEVFYDSATCDREITKIPSSPCTIYVK